MNITKQIQEAFDLAKKSREQHAYCPYSNFKVGAALKIKGVQELIVGVNVENVSYGGTICAERSALCSAISKFGKKEFEFLLVTADINPYVRPCGLCLQALSEFVSPNFPIYLGNSEHIVTILSLSELLPHAFSFRPVK